MSPRRTPRPRAVRTTSATIGLAALAVVAVVPRRAEAHAVGVSTGEYTAKGESVHVKLAFARGDVASVLPRLDANGDGHITAIEVESATKALESSVFARVHVRAAGASCTPLLAGASLTDTDGLTIAGRFDCTTGSQAFAVDVTLLDDLPPGHRHLARAAGVTTDDAVLYRDHSTFEIAPNAEAGQAAAAPAAPAATVSSRGAAWAFFKMGLEHILTGYDHLLFLLGLVLLRAKVKDLLLVVTAFTVAHSITLAIAVLGIFSPSPKFVEPAIALSIAYVGIENLFAKDSRKRWRITFPFGLIHGFGFAGALQAVDLPRAQLPVALVTFNLGVEAGQLFAMGLAVPMVVYIRREADWFEPRGVRVLSGAVAAAGMFWLVLRIKAL